MDPFGLLLFAGLATFLCTQRQAIVRHLKENDERTRRLEDLTRLIHKNIDDLLAECSQCRRLLQWHSTVELRVCAERLQDVMAQETPEPPIIEGPPAPLPVARVVSLCEPACPNHWEPGCSCRRS